MGVLFAVFGEVSGHRVAHRTKTDEADLEVMVAWGRRAREGIGLRMLEVEEMDVSWPVHIAQKIAVDAQGDMGYKRSDDTSEARCGPTKSRLRARDQEGQSACTS